MSIDEMKWRIAQQLDHVSEDAIKEVLELLEQAEKKQDVQAKGTIRTDINAGLDERIERNIELLKKLV